MFNLSAEYYDAIYSFKDYKAEARAAHEVAERYRKSGGNRLLDVACGTGKHLEGLQEWYDGEGLDLEPGLLEVAKRRVGNIPLHVGDMTNFELASRFDVITCLFSSIGYAPDAESLFGAIKCMASHLVPGGVLLVEPWFQPEDWNVGRPHMVSVNEPELKIVRMNVSEREGDLAICRFHYLVGTPEGVHHIEERHALRLTPFAEVEQAFVAAGLTCTIETPGLTGRGLFIGRLEA